ncbi:hypothetical protein N0V83_005210 [Neocucurbitaria cava]|uniref:Uncharacterized protein n=1 Tax=Neocucurbitaria cava TaxID=798079 RepID=A0A9W8Y987_9PLEO|nr:hypothetical protein N0V83_005210 [Neocucurbitaria cava]
MSTLPRHPTYINPRQPIHWVLDWDGTITKHDTLDALVNISASIKPDFPVQKFWEDLTQSYMDDYTATLANLAPGGILPKTIEEEIALIRKLRAVEQRSLHRVSLSGIFAGLTTSAINAGIRECISSGQIGLRRGFAQFFESMQTDKTDASGQHKSKSQLSILSVNWSQHFIASCLRAFNTPIPASSILSNELQNLTQNLPSNGHIGPSNSASMMIVSSDDKLRCLERLKQEREASSSSPQDTSTSSIPIVYVGDSLTDIECLLAADLGICIRDEPMGSGQRKLAELDRLGVKVPRLKDWREADEWNVVWARDFVEIREWVEGLEEESGEARD